MTFTITVTNQGQIAASMFELTDHLPTGLTLADNDWRVIDMQTAKITVNTPLAPGASTMVDITTLVGDVTGDITNVAEISSDD